MITTNELPAATGKGRLIALWTPAGLVALAFMGPAATNRTGTRAVVEQNDQVGVGLLSSRYALNAAVLLAAVLVGPFIAHATVLDSSSSAAVALFVLTGIIAYSRKH
jgi:hypothetical protein